MKLSRQQSLILNALERAGAAGCSMRVLNAICYRYGGRIHELNKLGYDIRCERVMGQAGVFRYTLHAPAKPEPFRRPEDDQLFGTVRTYGVP